MLLSISAMSGCFAQSIDKNRGVFRVIEVQPSPFQDQYKVRFRLANETQESIGIPYFSEPVGNRLEASNYNIYILRDAEWIFNGSTSYGFETYLLQPQSHCDLIVDVNIEGEVDTAMVKVELPDPGLWSEPFALNLDADRKNKMFLAAKKKHFSTLTDMLGQIGFKKVIISQENFYDKLFLEIRKAVSIGEKEDASSFVSDPATIIPKIWLNHNIEVNVVFGKNEDLTPRYSIGLYIDPIKFSKKEFLKLKNNRENYRVFISETGGISISLTVTDIEENEIFSIWVKYRGGSDIPADLIVAEGNASLDRIYLIFERLLRD